MQVEVDSFFVSNFSYSEQNAAEYTDVSLLKSYQEGKTLDSTDACTEIAFVCEAVEIMTELRYEAERSFREGGTRAVNRRGELMLNIESMADKMTLAEAKDPPEQLISVIANQHYSIIENIINAMRKELRRKRSFVPISDVQQVDSQCLRWLAKQPGRYAAEKAGSQQKILAVVRNENRNTLENRVLKDFAVRAEIMARRYVLQHQNRYPESARVKEVIRLHRLFNHSLKSDEMRALDRLKTSVQPNYVLLHDSRYSKLWELYRLVLAHARMAEIVWNKRHCLFSEMFCAVLAVRLYLEYDCVFDSSFWINVMPTNGCFLVKPVFTNVYKMQSGKVLSLKVASDMSRFEIRVGEKKICFRFVYIPASVQDEIEFPESEEIYIVCSFSAVCLKKPKEEDNVIWVSSVLDIDSSVSKLMQKVC